MGADSDSYILTRRRTIDSKAITDDNEMITNNLFEVADYKVVSNDISLEAATVPSASEKAEQIEGNSEDDKKLVKAKETVVPPKVGTDPNFKRDIVWFNAIGFLMLHLAGAIGVILMLLGMCKFLTVAYFIFTTMASGMGITMGAHRLFTHRTFKATLWVKVVLLWLHTMAGQNCLYVWVRDHRQHHKYSDTDADPHNANRGFFFSHIGWLMSRKHPKVIEYGQKIDMSDIESDPWVMFQKRYYKTCYTIFTILIPTAIPIYCWGEDPILALFATYFARTVLQLNFTWSVNSVAHIWGNKPYDKNILPVESKFVALVAGGEGWHNYHHTFPWDYRAAELGMPINMTTSIIDFLAKFGAVYDRRFASESMVKSRVQRTGDGSHEKYGDHHHDHPEEVPYEESLSMDDNNNNGSVLSKYIVGKSRAVNKLTLDRLENEIEDLNNNESNVDHSISNDRSNVLIKLSYKPMTVDDKSNELIRNGVPKDKSVLNVVA